jgi:hypothetical protein
MVKSWAQTRAAWWQRWADGRGEMMRDIGGLYGCGGEPLWQDINKEWLRGECTRPGHGRDLRSAKLEYNPLNESTIKRGVIIAFKSIIKGLELERNRRGKFDSIVSVTQERVGCKCEGRRWPVLNGPWKNIRPKERRKKKGREREARLGRFGWAVLRCLVWYVFLFFIFVFVSILFCNLLN